LAIRRTSSIFLLTSLACLPSSSRMSFVRFSAVRGAAAPAACAGGTCPA
jgi:hypothetical protein